MMDWKIQQLRKAYRALGAAHRRWDRANDALGWGGASHQDVLNAERDIRRADRAMLLVEK